MYGPAGGCRGNTDLCRAVLAGTMRKVAGAACNGANCGVNGIAAAACGEGCAGETGFGGRILLRNEKIAPGKSYCVKICILRGKKLYLLMKNDFQPIKSDMQQERDKLCYLTIGDKDEKWGVVVTTIGYQFIPPGTKYPLSAHPDKYSFMPRGGRILNEYQLVYITKGSGYFASQSCPEAPVKAGTVISLFPGEWHSYHPDDETGWDEYWVGFKGSYIDDRVANRFLVREQPLHNIGISSGIVSLYEEILQLASAEKAGCQQMMSSIVLHILGSIYYKERNNSYANTFILEKVNAARELMKDVDNPRDVEAIARELGVSYSWFRKTFKEYTGISPAQYQLQQRLLKAKEMLTGTDINISDIAYALKFVNTGQFSTFFKHKEGVTPSDFRKRNSWK